MKRWHGVKLLDAGKTEEFIAESLKRKRVAKFLENFMFGSWGQTKQFSHFIAPYIGMYGG